MYKSDAWLPASKFFEAFQRSFEGDLRREVEDLLEWSCRLREAANRMRWAQHNDPRRCLRLLHYGRTFDHGRVCFVLDFSTVALLANYDR